MKKILIVSRSFYPENSPRSFRTTELIKEFSRLGHDVTLLTIERDFDYTDFLNKYSFNLKSLGKLKLKPFTKSNWKLIGDIKRKFGRLLNVLFHYPEIELMWLVKNKLKSESGYDLMISIAVPYPVHWGTAWARHEDHPIAKTWVADCGDPFYKNTLESFPLPFYFSYIEKWFSRKTDYITIPFENLKYGFFKEFHHKIRIIPQGFNFDDIKISKDEPKNEKPKFAYAGGIGNRGVRNITILLKLLLKLENEFEFHIYATTGYELIIPFEKISNGKIILHETVSREILLPHLSEMDFLVNLIIDGTETKQVPSKLIDYALSLRPILNIDPSQPDIKLIREFLNKNYSRAYYVNNLKDYNINNIVHKYLELSD